MFGNVVIAALAATACNTMTIPPGRRCRLRRRRSIELAEPIVHIAERNIVNFVAKYNMG